MIFQTETEMNKTCDNCPYRRDSLRGEITFSEDRKGTLDGTNGLIGSILTKSNHICHKKIKNGMACAERAEKFPCNGLKRVLVNIEAPGTYKECFDSVDELKNHHVYKQIKLETKLYTGN